MLKDGNKGNNMFYDGDRPDTKAGEATEYKHSCSQGVTPAS
jgi:hypothetical protein